MEPRPMNLAIDPTHPEAPYAQVREQIRGRIRSGALKPGTRLPTVRRLAEDLGLATNTVARAYRELEALGEIETRGRAGSVVTGGGVDREARAAAHEYATALKALGVGVDEGIDLLRRAYE